MKPCVWNYCCDVSTQRNFCGLCLFVLSSCHPHFSSGLLMFPLIPSVSPGADPTRNLLDLGRSAPPLFLGLFRDRKTIKTIKALSCWTGNRRHRITPRCHGNRRCIRSINQRKCCFFILIITEMKTLLCQNENQTERLLQQKFIWGRSRFCIEHVNLKNWTVWNQKAHSDKPLKPHWSLIHQTAVSLNYRKSISASSLTSTGFSSFFFLGVLEIMRIKSHF